MAGSDSSTSVVPFLRGLFAENDGETPSRSTSEDAWLCLDVPVAVLDVEMNGPTRWAAINPAQEQIMGVTSSSLEGRLLEDASEVGLEVWVCERLSRLLALSSKARFEPDRPDADTLRWVARTVTPIRDRAGVTRRLVIVSEDVSAQRRIAALLEQASKMEAVGRVASHTAREFNNLMVALSGYTGMALRSISDDAPAHDHLNEALRLADIAGTMARQLMALTHRQDSAAALVRIDSMVSGLEPVLTQMLPSTVSLSLRYDDAPCSAKVDAHAIGQMVLHMASHARASMPRGGALSIDVRSVTLPRDEARAAGISAGSYVQISMIDTGEGIDPMAAARLADPQLSLIATRSDTEVGVAACHGVVRRYGGALTVTSIPGQGTTFKVFLPRALEKATVSGVTPASAPPKGDETVLLLDATPAREPTAQALRMLGYTVLDHRDAAEALEALSARGNAQIHLVIFGTMAAANAGGSLLRAVGAHNEAAVLVTETLPPTSLPQKVRQALDARR